MLRLCAHFLAVLPLVIALQLPMAGVAAELQPVTLQLKWKHQFQFAGYYAALEQGYYRDAGLDVRFLEAKPGEDSADTVLSGKAAFGVGTTDLLLRRAKGQPFVVLGVVFQHSPLALMALQESGIDNLHQIAGRKVMIEPGSTELMAYLQREGIATGRLSLVPHSFDATDLLAHKVDAMSVYTTDETYAIAKTGKRFSLYSPRAGGIDFYGDNLFTTTAYAQQHPEQVAAFREASFRGWQYAMQHPAEIVDLILARYHPAKNRDQLLYEAEQMAPLVQAGLVEPGYMHPGRWKHIAEVYTELGMLQRDAKFDGLLYEPPKPHLPGWVITIGWIGLALALTAGMILFVVYSTNRRLEAEVGLRRLIESSLQASEARYRFIYESAPLAFVLMDLDGNITDWNRQAANMFEWMASEILGESIERLAAEGEGQHLQALIKDTLDSGASRQTTLHNVTRDGRRLICEWTTAPKPDSEGKDKGILCLIQDVTDRDRMRTALETANDSLRNQLSEIESLKGQLMDQALRDPLSGLYNRRYLHETEARELARAHRDGYSVAYLVLDVDRFKEVNDNLGHGAGDQVIRKVANLLQANSRSDDIVCRFGGDEFLMLLPRMTAAAAQQRAEALRQSCQNLVFEDEATTAAVTLSIGIALYPAHGQDSTAVMRAADEALYRSKADGRNRVTLAADASA